MEECHERSFSVLGNSRAVACKSLDRRTQEGPREMEKRRANGN